MESFAQKESDECRLSEKGGTRSEQFKQKTNVGLTEGRGIEQTALRPGIVDAAIEA